MENLLKSLGIGKKEIVETKFSKFFREASSAERKKVFLRVAKKATLDQQKVMSM